MKVNTPGRRSARLSKTVVVSLTVKSETDLSYADIMRICRTGIQLAEYGIQNVCDGP